jgi:hypothetical protein
MIGKRKNAVMGRNRSDAIVVAAFCMLARTAGIDYHEDNDDYMDLILSILKPKYRRKKVAQKTLALAVGGPPVSVDKFRQTILGCVKSNCVITSQVPAAASIADMNSRPSRVCQSSKNKHK